MRVFLGSVGCRLNRAEIETMAQQLRAAGHQIVATAEAANLAVVNTCSVTAEAASDSRGMIRRLARLGTERIVATGCWATLDPASAARLPAVSNVVPNSSKHKLLADVTRAAEAVPASEPLARLPLPGAVRRTRAFVKVQDGCDNHCTFCVTRIARGPSRSHPIETVVANVEAAVLGGAKEVVLTGVQLCSWGHDFGLRLSDLLGAILADTDVPRIRLSSLEPWNLDAGFFEIWRDRRVCPHFHFPLQSGCAATLKRMARKTTPASFKSLVHSVREALPDASITTDLIAGFPGESDEDFRISLDFVRELRLAGGHAFTYSPMRGTAAARLPSQVPLEVRRRRNGIYIEALKEGARAFRTSQIGLVRPVLWESSERTDDGIWVLAGLTDNNVRATASAAGPRWNKMDQVRLEEPAGEAVLGIISKTG